MPNQVQTKSVPSRPEGTLFLPPEKKRVGDKENYLTDAAIYGKNRTYVRYERKKTKNGKNRSKQYYTKNQSKLYTACSDVVGEDGFEPSKSKTTDLQSAPFGRSGTLPCVRDKQKFIPVCGAGDGTRTRDLLITNQLLYQLSYTSIIFKNII